MVYIQAPNNTSPAPAEPIRSGRPLVDEPTDKSGPRKLVIGQECGEAVRQGIAKASDAEDQDAPGSRVKTTSPSTMVNSGTMSLMRASSHVKTSSERTTRSARLPGSSEPSSFSPRAA